MQLARDPAPLCFLCVHQPPGKCLQTRVSGHQLGCPLLDAFFKVVASGLELPHEMFSLLARLLGTCDVLKDQQQVASGMIRTFQSSGLEQQHQRISSRADFAMNLKMDDCGAVH